MSAFKCDNRNLASNVFGIEQASRSRSPALSRKWMDGSFVDSHVCLLVGELVRALRFRKPQQDQTIQTALSGRSSKRRI